MKTIKDLEQKLEESKNSRKKQAVQKNNQIKQQNLYIMQVLQTLKAKEAMTFKM